MTGENKVKEDDMTDMDQGSASAMDNSSSAPVESAEPVQSSPAPVNDNAERRFTQSDVNDIVGKVRSEARQRTPVNQGSAPDYQPQQQQYHSETNPNPGYGQSQDNMRQMMGEEFDRRTQEWAQQSQHAQQQQEAERVAQDFFTKIEAGKGDYPDFEEQMRDFEYGAIPDVVQLATQMDNTAAIMYELKKNPSNIGILKQLTDISPNLALAEMKNLSNSIKQNSGAQNYSAPNEPLSQMRASNQGMDSKGALTVADYKAKYRI